MAWDAGQYLKFETWRRRPAQDLLAAAERFADRVPARVVDLGCGTGSLARGIAARWPQAKVTGIDSSATMLARAAATPSPVTWIEADIAAWPTVPDVDARDADASGVDCAANTDMIISNAALHWLDDHAALFPRLLGSLAADGVLAVQMPRNFDRPAHREVWDLAGSPPWRERLAHLARDIPVATPDAYYDWLAPLARAIEIWESDYFQVLEGEQPVLEWLRGTTLVPVAEALGAGDFPAFLAALAPRLAAAYPRRRDGMTFFAFRRIFILARR